MNEAKSNPLTDVEKFQQMLKEAIQYGYDVIIDTSFDFSPVDIVLDCAIDIILLLRRMFTDGAQSQNKNFGLGFSEKYQDVLGNPKQFRITTPSTYYWDPKAQEYFYALAQTLVEIKNQKDIKESFHDFLEILDLKTRPQPRGRDTQQKRRAQYQWWRRQRRRFRRHEQGSTDLK